MRASKEVINRVKELADEYGVDEATVWSLYQMMPNELYDGIPAMLEDMGWEARYGDSVYDDLLIGLY